MFGQNLPISAAFTDIENEATTLQRNAVCIPSARRSIDRLVMSQNKVTKTSGGVWF